MSLYLHDHLPLLTSTIDNVLINNQINNNNNNNDKDYNKNQHIKNFQQNQNRRKHPDRLKHLSNQFQTSSLNVLFKDYSENILRDFLKIFIKNKDNIDVPIKIKHLFLLELLTNCRYLYIKDMEKKANTFIFTTPIINYEQAQQFVHDGNDIISDQIQSIIEEYDQWYRDLQRKRLGLKHPVIIEIDENNRKQQQQQKQQLITSTTDNESHNNGNLTDEHIANVVKGVISALDLNNTTDTSSSFSYNSKRISKYNESILINHQTNNNDNNNNKNNYNNSNSSHNRNNVKTKKSSAVIKLHHHHHSNKIRHIKMNNHSSSIDDDYDYDNKDDNRKATSIENHSLLLLHSVTIEAMIAYYMKITEYIQRMKEIQLANRRERHNNHIYSSSSNNNKDSNDNNNNDNNYNSNNSQNINYTKINSDVNHRIYESPQKNSKNTYNNNYNVSNSTSASYNNSYNLNEIERLSGQQHFIIPQPPIGQKIHNSKPPSTRLTKIKNHYGNI